MSEDKHTLVDAKGKNPPLTQDQPSPPARVLAEERRMGPCERFLQGLYAQGIFVTLSGLLISGPLDERILRQALAVIQRRHPLLRVHVPRPGHDFVTEGTEPIPFRVVQRDSPDRWKMAIEEELNRANPCGRHPLIRLVWVTDRQSTEHEILMVMSHAIGDGITTLLLVYDFLNACQAALEGTSNLTESLESLPPMEALIPRWMKEKQTKVPQKAAGILPIDQKASPSKRRTRILFRVIDAQFTKRLAARCREQGGTVHGALCAASLKACRALDTDDRELGLSTNINLRDWLEPPVPFFHVGTYISSVTTHHLATPASDFWALAREVNSAVSQAIERVQYLDVDQLKKWEKSSRVSLWFWGKIMRFATRFVVPRIRAGRLQALNVTNMGRVPYSLQFGPFKVKAAFGTSSQHLMGSSMQVSVGTFGGAMCFAFTYAEPILRPARAGQFIEAFECELRRAIGDETAEESLQALDARSEPAAAER